MAKSHNKRRNPGLLKEFLVTCVSKALVEGDQRRAKAALRLIKRHFKPGTHLHKEWRLVEALVRTHVSSEAVAASIIVEAKQAARTHDEPQLEREKTNLIHAINRTLNEDGLFFDQPVADYRSYATVQTLLNGWRMQSPDIGLMAMYEDTLVKHLITDRVQSQDVTLNEEQNQGEARLLMKVMMKRLNERWGGKLNAKQRELVRAYAFSSATDDGQTVKMKMEEVRTSLVEAIDRRQFDLGGATDKKLEEAKSRLLAEDLSAGPDDAQVTRFMLYAKLGDELMGEGEEASND